MMDVPGQNGLLEGVMLTDAGNPVLTIIVIGLDEAGLPVVHSRDEFIVQVTTSPPAGI